MAEALATMEAQAVDVLAVDGGERVGVVTRMGLEQASGVTELRP